MTSLNYINYLNLIATFFISIHTLEIDLGPEYEFLENFNMNEFPRRYEEGSLTPAEPFFFVFNIVALALFVFAVVQLLPAYRSSPMVQDGIQHWYFSATVAQVLAHIIGGERGEGFTRSFISFLFFGVMCGCVWKILYNQANLSTPSSTEEYWILRFPFSLHAGWCIALVIMSANVLFRAEDNNDDDGVFNGNSFMSGLIVLSSLVVYGGLSVKLLFLNGPEPNYVVPACIAILTFGVALNAGADDRDESWGHTLLKLSLFLISIGSAAATAFLVYTKEYKNKTLLLEDEDESSYQAAQVAPKASTDNATMA
jgi:hypothetical protein